MLRKPLEKAKQALKQKAKSQSELDQDFIAAFRQGQSGLAHAALDLGANPSYELVHAEMLRADPAMSKAAYRAMWELFFEMRGPLGDAEEIVALSLAIRRGADGQSDDRSFIARKAIGAHTPKNLLREVGGQLLVDAAASGDAQSVRLMLDRGADVFYVDAAGSTVLQHAALAPHPDVFRLLIDAGLDPLRCKAADGKPLLMTVAAAVTTMTTIGRAAANEQSGANSAGKAMQGFLARRQRDQRYAAETLRLLLVSGLKPNQQWRLPHGATPSRSQPLTPLQAAMRAHNPLAVAVLLHAGAKTDHEQHRAFASAFARHVTEAFEDATVDALSIIGLMKPRRVVKSAASPASSSPLHAAIAALAARRWTVDGLAPIAPARRAALMQRLNRSLVLPPEVLCLAVPGTASAFMLAVQSRLPGVVAQLVTAGVLPALTKHAVPPALQRVVQSVDAAAGTQLAVALNHRKPDAAVLGQGWNVLIAQAFIAADGGSDAGSRLVDETKAGKALWCKVLMLRHAHQCEVAGMDRLSESGQRAQLLRALSGRLTGLSWETQWKQGIALLAAWSVFDAVRLDPKSHTRS